MAASSDAKTNPVVTGLNIFPIKSCKACPVTELTFDSYGVVGDRRFMLVDGGGRFISQRKYSRLSLLTVIWVEDEKREKILKINGPGMNELIVVPIYDGERIETSVWSDTVMTVDQGQEASNWFSKFLEFSTSCIRLVAAAEHLPGYARKVSNVPPTLRAKLPPASVHLADSGPVSLISNESLADLNEKLKERVPDHQVPLSRFRMNIEITGCTRPFEEDEWLLVKIASTPFLVYVANERCKMTAVDQDTGIPDKLGPLEILRQYRAPAGPAHAKFGQFMMPLQVGGTVKLGDTVTVLDWKK